MKTSARKSRRSWRALIEPLESRIAPAAVVAVTAGDLLVSDANKNAGDDIVISLNGLGNFELTDSHGITAGAGATQVNSVTVDVPQSSVSGILHVALGEGTNGVQLSAGLPSLKGIAVDAGFITPLPALSVGTSGLQITVSGSDIEVDGAITFGGNVSLNAIGANESVLIANSISTSPLAPSSVSVGAAGSIVFSGSGAINNGASALGVFLTADSDSDGGGAIINSVTGGTPVIVGGAVTVHASQGIALALNASTLSAVNLGSGGISLTDTATVQVTHLDAGVGAISLAGGTFVLGSGATVHSTSSLDVTGGVFDLGGTAQSVTGVTLASGAILDGTLTCLGPFTVESGTIGAALAGSFTLLKTTPGIVIFSSASTYTGGTEISQGTVEFGNPGAFGHGKILLNDAATGSNATALLATAVMNSAHISTGNGAFANSIVVQNFGTQAATIGTTLFSGSYAAGSNATDFTGTILLNASVDFLGGNTEQTGYLGPINGNPGSIAISGASTTYLGTKNSFTGTVSVNDSILLLHADYALGGSANTLTLNDGTLAASGFFTMTRSIDIPSGISTINVSSGTLTLNGSIGGSGTFVKTGSGKLVLGSSYIGDSTLSHGSLAVAGATITVANAGQAQISVVRGANAAPEIQSIDLTGTDSTTNLTITGPTVAGSTVNIDSINVAADIGLISLGASVVLGDGLNDGIKSLSIAGNATTLKLSDIASYAEMSLGYATLNPAADQPALTIRNVLGPGVVIAVAPDNNATVGSIGGGGLGRVVVNSWTQGGEIDTTRGVGISSFTLVHGDCHVNFNVDPASVGAMLIEGGAWGGNANILGPIGTFSAEGFLSGGSISADDIQTFQLTKNLSNPTEEGYAGSTNLTLPNDPLMKTFSIYGDFTGTFTSASSAPNITITGNFYGSLTAASVGNITAYAFNGALQNNAAGLIKATSGALGTISTSDGGVSNYNIFVESKFAGFNIKDTASNAGVVGLGNVHVEAGDITSIIVGLKAGTAAAGIQNSTFEASATALALTFAGAGGNYTGNGSIGTITSSHSVMGSTFSAWTTIGAVTIGSIDTASTFTNSMLLAGSSLGGDGVLGGVDPDSFTRSGKITSVTVKGVVSGSTIAVGVNPNGSIFGDGDDTAAVGSPTAPDAIGALVFGAGSGVFTASPEMLHDDAIEGATIKSLKIGAGATITNFVAPHYLQLGGSEAATDILVKII